MSQDGSDLVHELETFIKQLGPLASRNVTVETVFTDGGYVRGFLKIGPLTADEMRRLTQTPTAA